MRRVIVLGATGFIGGHVAEQLYLAGYPVQAYVRPKSNSAFLETLGIPIDTIDFTDSAALRAVFRPDDLVINCIAYVKVHQTLAALRQQQVSVLQTATQAAIHAGVQRHILLSSVEVYGFEGAPWKSETTPYRPEFAFQHALVAREQAFIELMRAAGAQYTIVQPASTIGARETHSSFFAKLYQTHVRNRYPLIAGGRARVSLVDTRDIGRAMVALVAQAARTNDVFLVKGYDTTWRQVKQALDQVRERRAWSVTIPPQLVYPYAQLLERVLPYTCEPIVSPLSVKLLSQDVLIDDTNIRRTGFLPRYTLIDSVRAAVQSLEPHHIAR